MLGLINYSFLGGGGHQNIATAPLPDDRVAGADFEKVLFAALMQSEMPTNDPELPVDDAQVDTPDVEAEGRIVEIGSEDSGSETPPDGATPDSDAAIAQGPSSAREMRNPTRDSLSLVAHSNNATVQSQTASRPMTEPGLSVKYESDLRGEIPQKQLLDPRNISYTAEPAILRPARPTDADPLSGVRSRHDDLDPRTGRYATEAPRSSGSVGHSESSPQGTKLGQTAGTEVTSRFPKMVETTSPGKVSELIGNTTSRPSEGAPDANLGTSNNVPVFAHGGRVRSTEIHGTYREESHKRQKYENGNMQLAQSETSVSESNKGIGRDTASVKQSDVRALRWSVEIKDGVAVSRWNLARGEPTQTDLHAPTQPTAQTSMATGRFESDVIERHKRSTSGMDPWKNVVRTDTLRASTVLSSNGLDNRLPRVAPQAGLSEDGQLVHGPREYFKDGADGRSDAGRIRVTEPGDALRWRAIVDPSSPRNDTKGSGGSFVTAVHGVPLVQSSEKAATWTERDLEVVAVSHVEARPASGSPVAAHNMTFGGNHAASVIRQIIEVSGQLRDGPIEVSLSPEELGRVRMQIVSSDQGVVIHITAERGETLEMLRRHIDQLHRDLSAMGHENPRFSFDREGAQDQRRARPQTEPDQIVASQTSTQHPAAASHVRTDCVDIRI